MRRKNKMPNWCENSFVIVGKENNPAVDTLYHYLEAGDFLERLIPTPKELLDAKSPNDDEELKMELMAKYGSVDWYWWRVNNWGTKWDLGDISNIEVRTDNGYKFITFSCDTAWSPPEEGFQKISGMTEFRNIYFYDEYRESGMGFEGFFSFVNGESRGSETVSSYVKTDDVLADFEFYLGEIEEESK
jgi:hypothetical protein